MSNPEWEKSSHTVKPNPIARKTHIFNPLFYVEGGEIGVELGGVKYPADEVFIKRIHKDFTEANARVIDLANECERLAAKVDEMREDYIRMGIVRNIVIG